MKMNDIILKLNIDKNFKKEFVKSFFFKNSGRAKIAKKFNISEELVRLGQYYLRGRDDIQLSDRMQQHYNDFKEYEKKILGKFRLTVVARDLKKDPSTVRACYYYSIGQSMNFKDIYEN